MVYPALVFGVALLNEDKPGKKFWFFVVNYTCAIILLQCITQQTIWSGASQQAAEKMFRDLDNINFGLVYIPSKDYKNFWRILLWFAPEIGIIISTLALIQKETLAGIFDVSLAQYESFSEGLERQASILMEKSEKAKQSYQTIQVDLTTKEKLQVDPSLARKRFKSEQDASELKE